MNRDCWKCGKEISDLTEKVPFRFTCPFCDSYQHCCVNCKNYQVGLPNDCKIPGTEFVADRQSFNYCEEFSLLGNAPKKGKDPKDVLKRLFGDEDL